MTDLLATRLMAEHIPASQILRLYAPCRDEKSVPENLIQISNFVRTVDTIESIINFR
jgi:hypothetical protein